jgi:hypothetical protein
MTSKITALAIFLVVLAACNHTYDIRSSERTSDDPLLQRGASILVGVPLDGQDGHHTYEGSGKLTNDAVVVALVRFTDAVEAAAIPETLEEYVAHARAAGIGYVVFPEILIWKDRNTRRWGLPDLMELQLTLADAATGETLDTTVISGASRIEWSWNDKPQDLLPAPLERYASSLFEEK